MMYFRTLINGLDSLPARNDDYRLELEEVKKQNSDTVNVYKSKPSLRLYFYNTITKKKTDLKKDDKYIFVGDKLYLEIQASGEKYGCYLVSKFKTKKVLSYKD